MLRFFIADDHTVSRQGIRFLLQNEYPSAHIEDGEDAEILIKKVAAEPWNLIITDLAMPGRSGLEALQQIKQLYPQLPVLIISGFSEEEYAVRALKAGAAGYIRKNSGAEELLKAVAMVLAGKKYISQEVTDQIIANIGNDSQQAPHQLLSDRELEVLKLIGSGKSVSAIAEQMILSISTISTYRARILFKMKAKTNADLILYAIEHKIR